MGWGMTREWDVGDDKRVRWGGGDKRVGCGVTRECGMGDDKRVGCGVTREMGWG